MKELLDESTGAIIFRNEDESNPTEKRIKILESKIEILESEVEYLKYIISKVMN